MQCCWRPYRNAYKSWENMIVDLKYLYTLGYSNSFQNISQSEPYFSLISGSVLKKHLALNWEFAGNLDFIPGLNAWPRRCRVSASRNIHWKTGCLVCFTSAPPHVGLIWNYQLQLYSSTKNSSVGSISPWTTSEGFEFIWKILSWNLYGEGSNSSQTHWRKTLSLYTSV